MLVVAPRAAGSAEGTRAQDRRAVDIAEVAATPAEAEGSPAAEAVATPVEEAASLAEAVEAAATQVEAVEEAAPAVEAEVVADTTDRFSLWVP